MQYVTDGHEKYIWYHHTGEEMYFDLDDDPSECRERSKDPEKVDRVALWRNRLADLNEERGDPRGQGGELIVQDDALKLSPNYNRWKARAEETMT